MISFATCMAKLTVFMSSAHCMAKLTVYLWALTWYAHCMAKLTVYLLALMLIAWQKSHFNYDLLCLLHGKTHSLANCMAKFNVLMSSYAHCMAKNSPYLWAQLNAWQNSSYLWALMLIPWHETHLIYERSSIHGKTHRIDELFNNILVGFSVAEIHSRMKTNLSSDPVQSLNALILV
jgi:hypothetical protein